MVTNKHQSASGSELVPTTPQTTAVAVNEAWADDFAAEMEKGGFDLPKIEIVREIQQFKLPPGETIVKTFQGIYLGEARFNIKFPKPDGPEITEKLPPECTARDAIRGSREREFDSENRGIYGDCAHCWFNQFGSGKDGNGKACASRSMLMVWPIGIDAVLPYLMNLSVTSLTWRINGAPLGISHAGATVRQAMTVLKAPPTAIRAEFFLEKQSKGSQVWSILRANVLGTVDVEEYNRCRDFAKKYMPWLTESAVDLAQEPEQEAEVISNDDAGVNNSERKDRFEEAKARAKGVPY